ncbi:MBL fold metallo-hydrolase [Candidatus Parcubacteria bacterium]|nr:MBL fold metallo-hydrolase [Candidatus Parcubacteria bacterium]
MVAFLNIGQGDAMYIENKSGQSILIDTGNKDSGVLKQIQRVTSCYKVHIDTMILTHPDQDHIGEATNLIQKGYVGQVVHNGFINIDQQQESQTENDLEKIIQAKHILTQDMVIDPRFNFKDFTLTFLYPTTTPYMDKKGKGKSVDDNDYSIVFKLTHKNFSFMLTGDAPIKVEKAIVKQYCIEDVCPALHANVLKLGHHGSKNSSGIDFLKTVDAQDYIVSAGLNNKYNHPNEETIYRVYLNKKDSRVRETSLGGNIVYILN